MAKQDFTPKELESEEWRDVPGYEGIYEASNKGRVRRVTASGPSPAGKVLKPFPTRKGYHHVRLYKNREYRDFTVHSIVLLAFVGPRPGGKQVNHKDGDKSNNRLHNLEYVTASENLMHSYEELGREAAKGEKHGMAILTREQVREARRLYASGNYTYREIGEMYSVTKQAIYRIVKRKSWKHI